MNKKAFYGIGLGLLVPLLAFFIMEVIRGNPMPQRLFYDSVETKVKSGKEITDTVWSKVPDFDFTNQLGQKVSWKDIKGKIVVADFFFTRCPVICPQLTRNMKRLQEAVKNNNRIGPRDPDFVQFISFTVDPKNDSVAVLKHYADRYGINPQNWWLLTGNKADIYRLAIEGMKLGVTDTEVDTAFIHPQKFVLIDKDRVIRARRDEFGNPRLYNGLDSADVKAVAEDIILLMLEKDKKKKFFLADELPLIGVVFGIVIISLVAMFILFKERKNL